MQDCCTRPNVAKIPTKMQLMEDLLWLRTSLRRYAGIEEGNMRPETHKLLNFSVH
jgi:hypothetical protein